MAEVKDHLLGVWFRLTNEEIVALSRAAESQNLHLQDLLNMITMQAIQNAVKMIARDSDDAGR